MRLALPCLDEALHLIYHIALWAMQETKVRPLDWEDPLEKGKATHSSILVWRIPMSQRVGHY